MEKKKMKLWKKVLLVILVVLLVFIIMTARKMIILASLDDKVSEYQNSKNIYSRTVLNNDKLKSQTVEVYVKDDVMKQVIKTEKLDGTANRIIQITYPDERKFYTESETSKEMRSYKENNSGLSKGAIVNFAETYTLFEKLANSITANIKTEMVDGKECYVISSLYNSNILYDQGTEKMLIYLEKDTGLAVKRIAIVNKDGNKNEYITNYEYKFNSVTDNDIAEPDISEYEIKGN